MKSLDDPFLTNFVKIVDNNFLPINIIFAFLHISLLKSWEIKVFIWYLKRLISPEKIYNHVPHFQPQKHNHLHQLRLSHLLLECE